MQSDDLAKLRSVAENPLARPSERMAARRALKAMAGDDQAEADVALRAALQMLEQMRAM